MGSLYKRGKIYYMDVRANGRRIRKRVGTSKQVAELALKDVEVKIAREEFGFAKQDITLEKFLDKYLEYSAANHTIATQKRYRAVIDHLRRFIAQREKVVMISQIGSKELEEYKMFRKSEWVNPNGMRIENDDEVSAFSRRGARANTVNFELGTIRTILNVAIKWGYLRENPTKQVKRLKNTDAKLPRLLDAEECRRFLDHTPANLHPVFFTFLNTGMRKGELINLQWADIDLVRRKIKIRRKEDWHPKTGEREIPMNDAVFSLFQKLKKANDKGLKSKYVFPSRTGGRMKDRLREELIKIAKAAGITGLTKVHSLRHAFASHLVMAGVDLPTVQKLMGHSDIQTTMIYAHLAPDHLSEAVEKLKFLDG